MPDWEPAPPSARLNGIADLLQVSEFWRPSIETVRRTRRRRGRDGRRLAEHAREGARRCRVTASRSPCARWAVVDKRGQVIVVYPDKSRGFHHPAPGAAWCEQTSAAIRVTITPEPSDGDDPRRIQRMPRQRLAHAAERDLRRATDAMGQSRACHRPRCAGPTGSRLAVPGTTRPDGRADRMPRPVKEYQLMLWCHGSRQQAKMALRGHDLWLVSARHATPRGRAAGDRQCLTARPSRRHRRRRGAVRALAPIGSRCPLILPREVPVRVAGRPCRPVVVGG